jgi:protein-arginine kinase activator protein McsA
MARISKKVRIICPKCQYTYEDSYEGKFTTTKCPDCYTIFGIDERGKPTTSNVFYKKFADITGIGKDERGQEVAITTKGKRVSLEDTRYDTRKDPHGWRATGKKVKGYEKK